MAMKRTKKIKEMRPKVSSHLNVGIVATSITDADAQRTLNHKMAKRQKQPIHQLRIRPLPRLSRAGLSKCRLSGSGERTPESPESPTAAAGLVTITPGRSRSRRRRPQSPSPQP